MQIPRWKKIIRLNNGFTLIEIIMVLVLLGILGALGTMGLSTFIKNYSTSKQWTDRATAGQMAILRITKELIAISSVNTTASETDGTKIRFTANHNDSDQYMKIELSGSNLLLNEYNDNATATASSSDLLVPNVASFSLEYYDWVSDNDTLTVPLTTPSTACTTPFKISEFEKIYCKEDNDSNEQKIRFLASNVNYSDYSEPYMLYYGGHAYYFCTNDDGDEYRASEDATGTGGCDSNGWEDKIDIDIPYYDAVYIYPESNPECFEAYQLKQKNGDNCTPGDTRTNKPPPMLRRIGVTLQLEDLTKAFTISVAPRNL